METPFPSPPQTWYMQIEVCLQARNMLHTRTTRFWGIRNQIKRIVSNHCAILKNPTRRYSRYRRAYFRWEAQLPSLMTSYKISNPWSTIFGLPTQNVFTSDSTRVRDPRLPTWADDACILVGKIPYWKTSHLFRYLESLSPCISQGTCLRELLHH